MLILSRRIGETLCIGTDIRVTVTQVAHGQVRLGIDAPRNMTVDREEIYERKRRGIPPRLKGSHLGDFK